MTYARLPGNVLQAWPDLSPSAKAVAVALASFMDRDGECWPSREKIMERSGVRRTATVSKATTELEAQGLLSVQRRSRQSCIYRWPSCEGTTSASSGIPDETKNVLSSRFEGAESVSHEVTRSVPQNNTTEQKKNDGGTTATPPELKGLELYEADIKFVAQWPSLLKSWKRAYPGINIVVEVAKAHAWEVAHPNRRKNDRAHFLGGWLSRTKPTLPVEDEPPLLPQSLIDEVEANAAQHERVRA